MFSEEFRQRLQVGKYTRWALNLTEDDLDALFWMIGEINCRFSSVSEFIRERQRYPNDPTLARVEVALETIISIARGHHLNRDEARQLIQKAVFEAQSKGHSSSQE